jgi:ABC-type Fe3+/spermidine/putrescine transport system ATPase subunit
MLSIDGLTKSFTAGQRRALRRKSTVSAGQRAVDNLSITVEEGELFTFLGPSGCGKTTTLRAVAGLERPDEGSITLAGNPLFDADEGINVAANERGLGMVFQSYAIWPHLTVRRNVSFPLEVLPRRERPSKAIFNERVERVLEVTGLAQYADRPATKLSGGQQQRLALARAIIVEPPLLLLDEPLSNLDAALRESMRFELKRMQRELGITSVYVTHDQAEALALSSRIAVMSAGKLVQVGKPREIYHEPASRFVASFIGVSNFIDGVVARRVSDETRIETVEGDVWTSLPVPQREGEEVSVSIRPENLSIEPDDGTPLSHNQFNGAILTRGFLGESTDHIVSVGKLELRVRGNPKISHAPHSRVRVTVDRSDVVVVPRSDEVVNSQPEV